MKMIYLKFYYQFKLLIKRFKEKEIKKEDIKFLYRGTNLSKDLIIISAKFKGLISKKNK